MITYIYVYFNCCDCKINYISYNFDSLKTFIKNEKKILIKNWDYIYDQIKSHNIYINFYFDIKKIILKHYLQIENIKKIYILSDPNIGFENKYKA